MQGARGRSISCTIRRTAAAVAVLHSNLTTFCAPLCNKTTFSVKMTSLRSWYFLSSIQILTDIFYARKNIFFFVCARMHTSANVRIFVVVMIQGEEKADEEAPA